MPDIIGDTFPAQAGGSGPCASRLYMFDTKKPAQCDAIDRMFRAGIVRRWQYVPEVRHHNHARLLVEADHAGEFDAYVLAGDE